MSDGAVRTLPLDRRGAIGFVGGRSNGESFDAGETRRGGKEIAVDLENGEAWVEFTLNGQPVHWDLEVSDDWVDPGFYTKMQALAVAHGGGKRFFIVALGQDSLLCFGDAAMKDALSQLSGLKFQWE